MNTKFFSCSGATVQRIGISLSQRRKETENAEKNTCHPAQTTKEAEAGSYGMIIPHNSLSR